MSRSGIILVSVFCWELALSGCGGGGSGGGGTAPKQTYTVGGTVSGLTTTGFSLVDNGSDQLNINADGPFTFSQSITGGGTYQVRISTEPSSGTQLCLVTNGSGTAVADVTNVEVSCSTPSEQVLYSFGPPLDGNNPNSTLLFGNAGNLYGTTSQGGDYGYGTVFELTPNLGQWTETVLYSFCAQPQQNCPDGAGPNGNLVIDAAGNLYGTTASGGAYSSDGSYSGVVFKLTRQSEPTWSETVLHSFGGSGDGAGPNGMVFDSGGNLYGTASGGSITYGPVCPGGCGIVFELSPAASGQWTEQVLYSFCSQEQCSDGGQPSGGVTFDSSGNLFGTTALGGTSFASGNGTVFELAPSGAGQWTETVLYKFQGGSLDGYYPVAGVVLDQAGNIYGTTEHGYSTQQEGNNGIVFMLTRGTGETWTETVIYAFCTDPDCAAGGDPVSGLAIDKSGNLYGTTVNFGLNKGGGGVFALAAGPSNQMWSPVALYDFGSPSALVFDVNGNLYGTNQLGANDGEVFEITP